MVDKFGSIEYILSQLGFADPQDGHVSGSQRRAHGQSANLNTVRSFISAIPTREKLLLPIGRRGIGLSPAICKLVVANIRALERFARLGESICVQSAGGSLRTVDVRGMVVVEIASPIHNRLLRLTPGKLSRLLKYEAEIRRFAEQA